MWCTGGKGTSPHRRPASLQSRRRECGYQRQRIVFWVSKLSNIGKCPLYFQLLVFCKRNASYALCSKCIPCSTPKSWHTLSSKRVHPVLSNLYLSMLRSSNMIETSEPYVWRWRSAKQTTRKCDDTVLWGMTSRSCVAMHTVLLFNSRRRPNYLYRSTLGRWLGYWWLVSQYWSGFRHHRFQLLQAFMPP